MKVGSNGILLSKFPINTSEVNTVVWSIKSLLTTITKTYPSDVSYANGIFSIPLTQENTIALGPGLIKVEGQINYTNLAVGKTETKFFTLKPTLASQIISGNTPSGDVGIEELEFEIVGDAIIAKVEGSTDLIDDTTTSTTKTWSSNKVSAQLASKANSSDIPSLSGYATQTWVEGKGYLTEHQSLSGYATESWVTNKNYLTQHQPIKTINNQSLIGTGNITISGGGGSYDDTEIRRELGLLLESTVTPGTEQYVEQQIDIVSGYNWRYDTNAQGNASSNSAYVKYNVSEGDRLRITGSDGTSGYYPFLAIEKTDGTVARTVYTAAKSAHIDYEYTVPSGVAKVIVNTYKPTVSTIKIEKWVSVAPVTSDYVFADMNPLVNKKLGVDGDSICEGNSYAGGYAKIIGDNNRMTVDNNGVGGSPLTKSALKSADATDWSYQHYLKLTCYFDVTGHSYTMPIPITQSQYENGFGVYPTVYKYEDNTMVEVPYTETRPSSTTYLRFALQSGGSTIYVYYKTNDLMWNSYHDGFSGYSLYKEHHWICEHVTDIDSDCDYVILEGGLNDFLYGRPIGTLTATMSDPVNVYTVIGATEYICRQLLNNFTTKKLGFILVHKCANKDTGVGYAHTNYQGEGTLTDYMNGIKAALNKYSIPYCDLYNDSQFCTELDALKVYTGNGGDRVHPTKAGYDTFYVPKITSFLKRL